MADVGIEQLKEDIQSNINTNNNQEITGAVLQEQLIDTVDTLKGYTDGHVSVSQNTSTGHTDITIGGSTTPLPSITDLNKSLFYKAATPTSTLNGYRLNQQTAEIEEDSLYSLQVFECAIRDVFKVTYSFNGSTGTNLYAIYNSSTPSLSSLIEKGDTMVGKTGGSDYIEITKNSAVLIIICSRVTTNYNKIEINSDISAEISEIESDVISLESSEEETAGKVTKIGNDIYKFSLLDTVAAEILSGKRIASNGNIVDESYFRVSLFNVEAGQIYNLDCQAMSPTSSQQYAIYNSATTQDSTTCISVGDDLIAPYNKDIVIPENGVVLAVVSKVVSSTITTKKYQSVPQNLRIVEDSLQAEIETTNEELFGEKLESVTATRENGYYINWQGTVVENEYGSVYRKTVNAGEKYKLTQPSSIGNTGQYSYAVYSSATPTSSSLLLLGAEINAPLDADITIPQGGVLLVWGRVINYSVTCQKYVPYSRIDAIENSMLTKRLYVQYGSDGVKVNQKYSASNDIQYWLKEFGVNTLMQLYAHGFINNTQKAVSPSDPASYITSGSDWIGPYIMRALQNPTGGGFGFTGGCHGSNGNQTGEPTAETSDVKVYVDNQEVASGTSTYCDDVRVVVVNNIRAGNTLGENGRYVLEETVTYHFKDNKIYVSVCSKALESIRIVTYYGMQMNNYSQSARFFGKTVKDGTFSPSTAFAEKCFLGVGIDSNERICGMHLETVGLGCNEHTDTTKYCFTSGGKMYYSLIHENNPLNLEEGEKMYWSGWYEFSNIQKIDELTY